MVDSESPAPENTSSASKAPKNIVICSDGTWQKGGQVTPTNVWRTYLAVDPHNQSKIHDDGVGSGGIQLMQVIGGAFGYGISRNITQLLQFLISTYEPGAKIFLFGFSRGAFTVRVLADLVCRLPIPSAEGKSPKEIEDAANALLVAYKALNSLSEKLNKKQERPSQQTAAKPEALKEPPSEEAMHEYAIEQNKILQEFEAEYETHSGEADEDFKVHFVGCWDTVEAVGLPTDQLKKLAIRYMFPLRFADQFPNKKVKYLFHAMCLDDERHTFHPLLWHTPDDGLATEQVMEQVWFAGGHAHVGGGYAKDQLAMEPLEWMLEKAEGAGLKLDESMRKRFRSEGYRHGRLHPSRPGPYKFYRYQPRLLSELVPKNDRAECKVHASVLDRIIQRTDNYSPTAIDIDFAPVESKYALKRQQDEQREVTLPTKLSLESNKKFSEPMADANQGSIKQSSRLYWACVAAWLALFLWCCWNNTDWFGGSKLTKPWQLFGWLPDWLVNPLYSAEFFVLNTASNFVPAFVGWMFDWLKMLPGTLSLFVFCYWVLLRRGASLRNKTRESSLKAWHESGVLDFAAKAPEKTEDEEIPWAFDWERIIFLGCCLLGFVICSTLGWLPYHAYARTDTKPRTPTLLVAGASVSVEFPTEEPQFATGVNVQAGAEYVVDVEKPSGWKDRQISVTTADGFDPKPLHVTLERLRFFGPRKNTEGYKMFEVLGAVGPAGEIISIGGKSEPFRAPASGELFLFLNDFPGWYGNNQGTVKARIRRAR